MPTPNYLDSKTLDRIKRLDVRARLVVEGFITGQHRSPYHGFAVEFATHREYTPGDDTPAHRLEGLVEDRPALHQGVRGRDQPQVHDPARLQQVDAVRRARWPQWRDVAWRASSTTPPPPPPVLAYLLQQQQDAVGLVTFNTKVAEEPAGQFASEPSEADAARAGADAARRQDRRGRRLSRTGPADSPPRHDRAAFRPVLRPADAGRSRCKQFRLRQHEVIVFHVMHDDELTFPFRGQHALPRPGRSPSSCTPSRGPCGDRTWKRSSGFWPTCGRPAPATGVDYVLMNTKEPLDAVLGSYLTFRQKIRAETPHASHWRDLPIDALMVPRPARIARQPGWSIRGCSWPGRPPLRCRSSSTCSNKRKFKIVDWAAMDFLLDADKKNRRRVRLENLILLLLRCLAVFLIGLLLRAAVHSDERDRGPARMPPQFERIVLLDDSLSMQARLGNESAWEVGPQAAGRSDARLWPRTRPTTADAASSPRSPTSRCSTRRT